MYFSRFLVAASLAVSSVASQSGPAPPSQDPWYTAPPGFEQKSPGDVLRLRPAPGNLTAIYGNSSSAWNILYRTTDSNYRPSWAVTTLFVPKKKRQANDSLVSYQIPYNSPNVDSSPSYALYSSDYSAMIVGNDIQTLLDYGWFANVPDHEGPLASFLCSVQEGHATIDSIRAVKSLQNAWAPSKNVRVAMWGYSGGSLASEFAAELQVQYAPELSIAGMAIGGLPVNISTSFPIASGTYFAGIVAVGLIGMARQHPDLNRTLLASLKQSGPHNASTFFSVNHMTVGQAFDAFNGQDMSQYFTNGFEIFQTPAFQQAINNDALMGYHGIPQMPMFVYKAAKDELCPTDETDALVSRYCDVGRNVIYQKNSVGGHLAEETNGDASALQWLRGIMEGTYNHTGCTFRSVAINVTDSPL